MSRKIVFGALVIGALALGLYGLRPGGPLLIPEDPARAPAITVAGARLVKHDTDGHKLWELEARQIETFESESLATDVTLSFFDKEDRQTLIVKAPQVRLEHRTGDMSLLGTIEATGEEFSFTTENLRWDAQKKLLYTEAAIQVMGTDFELRGLGFEYSTETARATIKHHARLRFKEPR
ncbi:MAG: LPS export ABC transporter periplasmic protein LptC [Candidatus Bipolaricaulota bacterium]|nr:LPS export ABC transporter periplasmic protein LptC [Candidatus Bipolaricaulota bacterium]MDW8141770.1 LPS export ABC transporter periplasmic protein LptC [Candidatus Bipolaricaulota bacterium]